MPVIYVRSNSELHQWVCDVATEAGESVSATVCTVLAEARRRGWWVASRGEQLVIDEGSAGPCDPEAGAPAIHASGVNKPG
jgi:hypothetical protein